MQELSLPTAASITHLHLLAVVNTRIQATKFETEVIRLCDMGCGTGALLGYLAACLPRLNPGLEFEFYGADVADAGVQAEGFFTATVATLEASQPKTPWRDRLHLIESRDPWPFPDGYFHVIVSNQVLEHVADHGHFLGETYRTLATGGFSPHLFPLEHYFWEGHFHMPLVHRIKQHNLLRSYIRFWSRVGLGNFKSHRDTYGMTLDYYAEEHADYMTFMTNYVSSRRLLDLCKAARLRADFSYTRNFYGEKLRSILRRRPRYLYPRPRPVWDSFLFFFLKRVSSITLFLEKRQIYGR